MLGFAMLISKDKELTIGIFGRNYRTFGFFTAQLNLRLHFNFYYQTHVKYSTYFKISIRRVAAKSPAVNV